MIHYCQTCAPPSSYSLPDRFPNWPGGGGDGGGAQGPPGPQGPPGAAATITVLATQTLPAGQNANVVQGGTAQARTLTFQIPRGEQGVEGPEGPEGPQGAAAQGVTTNSAAPPASPQAGDIWTTPQGEVFVRRDTFWLQIV